MALKLNNTITPHSVDVSLQFGQLAGAMDWCRNNCTGEWHLTEGFIEVIEAHSYNYQSVYRFTFDDELDCINFVLRYM